MEKAEAVERARAGAALLDKRKPGWRDMVDLDALDMTLCESCVLGQVFGGLKG